MYQAYERPRTPQRFNTQTPQRPIETSPMREGKQNGRYANPSMVSNDVFYNKHYENPDRQMTPNNLPLGIPPNGYGKLNDYKDRYKQISGQQDRGGPGTPTGSNRGQMRSQLRDNYYQKSDGQVTPTRSQMANDQGVRTPTRRNEPHRDLGQQHDLRRSQMEQPRTPSDQQRGYGQAQQRTQDRRTPNRTSHVYKGPHQGEAIITEPVHVHDQAETRSQQSKGQQSNSTTLTNAELVCDNCINKHMIDDKRANERAERAKDEAYQNELLSKDKLATQQEQAEIFRRKEQFRQDAMEHWEENKRLKAQQAEGRVLLQQTKSETKRLCVDYLTKDRATSDRLGSWPRSEGSNSERI